MDVEWAHALAPAANIVLVEANSNGFGDLYQGITTAAELPGVSTVSLSWGSSEFAGESYWDSELPDPGGHQGVTFVAATGDGGAPGIYPAYSPDVVAAGGTTLTLNPDGSYPGRVGLVQQRRRHQRATRPSRPTSTASRARARTIPDVVFLADRSVGRRGLRLVRQHGGRSLDRRWAARAWPRPPGPP